GSGDTVVNTWQDAVYLDTGTTLDQNAVLLGSVTHYGLISGNGSYTQEKLVRLPINLLGKFNLFVVTNASGNVVESNTANDTSAPLPITISLQLSGPGGTQQAPVSDLQVTSVTAPGTGLTNSNIAVNWTVQNNGPGMTNANYWYDDVWLSTHATLGSGGADVYLATA